MSLKEMTRQQWLVAHFLAANLANFNVSKNLVMGLRDYLVNHPGTKPDDYLKRLVRLGNAFAGGEDEIRQRRELRQIVRDVAASAPDLDWPLILAWTVRLMVAYRPEARGPANPHQEEQIKARIQQKFAQNLKQLEEPYYG